VTAGGADGTAWKSCTGRLAEPPRVARFSTGGTSLPPLARAALVAFACRGEAGAAAPIAESAVAGVVRSSLLTRLLFTTLPVDAHTALDSLGQFAIAAEFAVVIKESQSG
jgi:hypothetical protein